jgi:RimJ/RimL family protein N-acetyltransferase
VARIAPVVRLAGGELRLLEPDDVSDAYVAGLRDPEVNRFLSAPREAPQTIETVRAYVAANRADPASALFGLYVDGALRGTVRLHDIQVGGDAFVGIALFDRSVWGRGWGRRCIEAVCAVASDLGVRRAVAGIHATNHASRHAFAAAGFVHDPLEDRETDDGVGERWYRTLGVSGGGTP